MVTQVQPDSPADQKGVRPGDVIVSVDRKPVREPGQVAEAVRVAHAEGDQAVLLLIDREGRQMFTAVPLATS